MRLYDIHAHLADARILPAIDRILRLCRQDGVAGILAAAAHLAEWTDIIRLAKRQGVHGALGLHPFFVNEWHDNLITELKHHAAANDGIAAIGEIGLDFYHGRGNQAQQIKAFNQQVLCAAELGLPCVFHNRKSWPEFLGALHNLGLSSLSGVCHHFSASVEITRQALDRGLYLSFCGPLTRASASRIKASARFVPLDRLLVESDCPDLAPDPFRTSQSRPWHVRYVVREVARLKGLSEEHVARAIEANFQRLIRPTCATSNGLRV